jgi:hypothetical protein
MLDPTQQSALATAGHRVGGSVAPGKADLAWRLVMVAVASAVPVAVFRPGLLNRDSLRMYRGAIGVEPIDDWNSPFLSLMLRLLHAVHVGPAGYVILQSLAFFAGVVMLCRAVNLSLRATCGVVLLVILFPPTLPWLATVEKSASMGCVVVLLVGLLALRPGSGKPWAFDLGIIMASVIAMLCRANALALVVPLLFLWRSSLAAGTLPRRLAHAALFAGLALIAFFAGAWLIATAFKVQRTFPEQALYSWDLAAISVARNEMLLPRTIYPGTTETLRAQYNPVTANHLLFPELSGLPGRPAARRTQDPGEMRELRAAWMRAIIANPGPYLRHRVLAFRNGLSLDLRQEAVDSWHYWNGGVDPNPFGITSRAVPWLFEYYRTWRETVFFRQFPYLGILLVLTAWFAWRRHSLGFGLAASSLVYFGHHLLVAPSPSLRNYYPAVFASLCCAILLADRCGSRATVNHADRAV